MGLIAGLYAATLGCGGDININLPTPLWVLHTYPANGAVVDREYLQTLTIAFSEALPTEAPTDPEVKNRISIRDASDAEIEIADFGYDQQQWSIRLIVDPQRHPEAFAPGAAIRILVGAGLRAASGATLPADVFIHFWVAEEPAP